MISWQRIRNLMNIHIEVVDGDENVNVLGNIEFKDVNFSYDDKNEIFNDLNLKFEKGFYYNLCNF